MTDCKYSAKIISVTIYAVSGVMNVIAVHVFVEIYKNVVNVYAKMR